MSAVAGIQNSSVECVKSPLSQTVSKHLTTAAKAAQGAAKTVFNIGTHPLSIYFVASSAFLSCAFGTSFPRTLMTNVSASLVGTLAVAVPAYARLKYGKNTGIAAPVAETSSPVISVTSQTFKTEVLESKTPVILDAYATWCGPCKAIAPTFDELSREMNGKIKFVKMDVDQERALAKELQIEMMPTFLIFKDGKIVDRQVGGMDKAAFLTKFVKHLI